MCQFKILNVSKITPELIRKILSSKIKSGKTDSEFDLTTDAMKNSPPELSDHLCSFLRACFIHGYMSLVLLMCAISPIIKDSKGKLDDSGNYRGIGIGSLILKIVDWIMLIVNEKELKNDENQFGFQDSSSTTMCTWTLETNILLRV